MRRKRLVIFGAGGHGREVAFLAERARPDLEVVFVVDDDYQGDVVSLTKREVFRMSDAAVSPEDTFVVAVGDPATRRRAAAQLDTYRAPAAILTDPTSVVSESTHLGAGCVVCAGSILTVDVHLGDHVHVNIGCSVSHDSRIGAFSTLSPGVRIAGNVEIGENVFIGIGASVVNGKPWRKLRIGDGAVVGAGACVTRNVPPNAVVVGVPAKPIGPGGTR